MPIARGTGTDRIKSWIITLTVTTATNTSNIQVIARNKRTGDYRLFRTDGNSEHVINIADLTTTGNDDGSHTGFLDDDVIEIKLAGGSIGITNVTVDTAIPGTRVTIAGTDVSNSNTPGRTY